MSYFVTISFRCRLFTLLTQRRRLVILSPTAHPPSCLPLDTSTKLKPGVITYGNKVMRYGTHLVTPWYPQLLNKSYGSDVTDFIIYTGADTLEDDDEPQMTEFVVVDAAEQKVQ